ncbi:unnamed protein product [Danaus chrysippus]|uniref:(African queen) hypothetical protein n=2 Tax=Danaus chrysippus TaxID=151541 RepID=A0A8J2QJL8_9NEOP|nr:unnamed protein product [Danaus chrysippus]
MTDENITVSDNSDLEDGSPPELRGYLSKWTNYIHGWQDRFIVLKESTLSYYKSELESNLGCRGALCLKKAKVKPHEFDDCRFDVSVNDCVWYLRASNPEEKQQWIDVLESFKVESGYGTSSDSSTNGSGLRRHGSVTSLQSTGSAGRANRRLAEKIAEFDTYTDLLSKQAVTLQGYFDMASAQINDDEAIDAVKYADGINLSQYSQEVRATSASFRATCAAAVLAAQTCADLLRRRETRARQAEELYMALKNQLSEARLASKPGPDHEVSHYIYGNLLNTFADDLAILTRNPKHCQVLLDEVDKFCEWTDGLRTKPSKCHCLCLGRRNTRYTSYDPGLSLGGQCISTVTENAPFKFLGRKIDNIGRTPSLEGIVDSFLNDLNKLDAGVIKMLKLWLGLALTADSSALFRGSNSFGMSLKRPSELYKHLRVSKRYILGKSHDDIVTSLPKDEDAPEMINIRSMQ